MEFRRSPLEKEKCHAKLSLPSLFEDLSSIDVFLEEDSPCHPSVEKQLKDLFPNSWKRKFISFKKGKGSSQKTPLRIGVVFSGGQAPGGHNVIAGIFDAIKSLHRDSTLIGFIGGPKGIVDDKTFEIDENKIDHYRNQGGFDLLGSGRDKIESEEDLKKTQDVVLKHRLDGLVMIGGDDTNTIAAFIAEYFLKNQQTCQVVGVPKTIDGDLKNNYIETPFGFDTAAKVYSYIIGNLARDALSARKYYFFVKIMGRSASHMTLEAALQTHPNLTLIGEEIAAHNKSLNDVINEITDLVCERAEQKKDYGVILIPEGVIEFIDEFKMLISEINSLLASTPSQEKILTTISGKLSPKAKNCFDILPQEIQWQLLLERDPHGNIQVSKIETERLFISMVKNELKIRAKRGEYKGKFNAQPYFCGYEGRSTFPSLFDASYCYSLGQVAVLLIRHQATGYMACIRSLTAEVKYWEGWGVPIVPLMTMEERKGKIKAVIKKAMVALDGMPFQTYMQSSPLWRITDNYRYPGPIQYFGPSEIISETTMTLLLESGVVREDMNIYNTSKVER